MNEDCLKLTMYFGERSRGGNRFLTDELLDHYAEHQIANCVMLRGAAGFGEKHYLRTDQTLSLSEDPPVVATAVDTAQRIRTVLDDVLAIENRGLLTIERSRILSGPIDPVILPETLHEATKLTIYVGRRDRVNRVPVFVAICELLQRNGISGASVLLGVDGTSGGDRRRARFFSANADVPVMVVAVGAGDRIAAVLPAIGKLLREPLITLERVRVCKRDGKLLARPHSLPGNDGNDNPLWQKTTIYTSESARHDGEPIHRALIRRLRASGNTRGATAVRGIWGFHGEHKPHGDRMFQLARHVPVTTTVIDTPERMPAIFDIVDELTREHGLVTTEMVPAVATATQNTIQLAHHEF